MSLIKKAEHLQANLLMAKCNMELEKYEEALENLKTVEEENPGDPTIIGAKLGVYRRMGADPSEIISCLLDGFLGVISKKDTNPKIKLKFFKDLSDALKVPHEDTEGESDVREVLLERKDEVFEALDSEVNGFSQWSKDEPPLQERELLQSLLSELFKRKVWEQQDVVQFLMDHSRQFSKSFLNESSEQIEAYLLKHENLMERGEFLKFVLKLGEVLDFDIILILKIKYSIFDMHLLKSLSNKYKKERKQESLSRLESLELFIVHTLDAVLTTLGLGGITQKPATPLSDPRLQLNPADFPDILIYSYSLTHFLLALSKRPSMNLSPIIHQLSEETTQKFSVVQVLSKLLTHLSTLSKAFPRLDRSLFSTFIFQLCSNLSLGLLTDVRCPKVCFPFLDNPGQLIIGSPFLTEIPYSDSLVKLDHLEWNKIKKSTSLKVLDLVIQGLAEEIHLPSTDANFVDGWLHMLSVAHLSNCYQNFIEILSREKSKKCSVQRIIKNLEVLIDWEKKNKKKSKVPLFVLEFNLQNLQTKSSLGKLTKTEFIAKCQRSMKTVYFPKYDKLRHLMTDSPQYRLTALHLILLSFTFYYDQIILEDLVDFLTFFSTDQSVKSLCFSSPICMSLLTELFFQVSRDSGLPVSRELLNEKIAPFIIEWKTTAFKLPFVDKAILKILVQTEQELDQNQQGIDSIKNMFILHYVVP